MRNGIKILRPYKAMRRKCLECTAGSVREVRLCHMSDCPLWPHRMGKRPTPEILEIA